MNGDVADLIRFETIRAQLQMATDEMAVRLARSSLSPVIRDYLDFSAALCDPAGRVVVQGFSLPLHLGAIPRAMEGVLQAFPGGLGPGDLAVLNDPYAGGMHLPDVFAVAPAQGTGPDQLPESKFRTPFPGLRPAPMSRVRTGRSGETAGSTCMSSTCARLRGKTTERDPTARHSLCQGRSGLLGFRGVFGSFARAESRENTRPPRFPVARSCRA